MSCAERVLVRAFNRGLETVEVGHGGKAFSLGAALTEPMLVRNKSSSESEPLSDSEGLLAFRSSIRALIISFEIRCLI